jgi:hypothetical protein
MAAAYSCRRLIDIFGLGFLKRARDAINGRIRPPVKSIFLFFIIAVMAWPGSGNAAYWNVFNFEGESVESAQFATYATLADMLSDTNRLGVFTPDASGAGQNIVGSDADGTTYWNAFNFEGESVESAQFATYADLADMLSDTNRTGVFTPDASGAGQNIIGSGADIIRQAVVPEPGSLSLLCAGLLGFGLLRSGRRTS